MKRIIFYFFLWSFLLSGMIHLSRAACPRTWCTRGEAISLIGDELRITQLERRMAALKGADLLRVDGKIKDLNRELQFASDPDKFNSTAFMGLRGKHSRLDELRGEASFLELQIRFAKLQSRAPEERLFTQYQKLVDEEKRIETQI